MQVQPLAAGTGACPLRTDVRFPSRAYFLFKAAAQAVGARAL